MATTTNLCAANTGRAFRVIRSLSVVAGDTGRATTVMTVEDTGDTSAPDRTLAFTAANVARGAGQFIIGSVPGRGNDRNATNAVAVEW
jgi:hypothetical protein